MLASCQQQLCGLVLADLMCARTSDTHASTCLMCAHVLQENVKPQEVPKGLEFITEWTNDWWCSIHNSELHWIINNSRWINKTCIWYRTAGIIPMCIFFSSQQTCTAKGITDFHFSKPIFWKMYAWQRAAELAVTLSHLLDGGEWETRVVKRNGEKQFVFITALTGRR